MARLLIVLGVAAVVFWVFSIVDCAVQSPARHRGVSKGAWIAIVILIPVLGGLLWFTIGRGRRQTAQRAVAPDDDPNFLGTIGGISDQDERIRLLEEELARLDSEADGPAPDDRIGPLDDDPDGADDGAGERPGIDRDGPDTDDDGRGRRGTAG
ncbi:PLD nuclease N-terminal domain-containing protein [Microbacterium album]|uniref:Cardiolipin synthase N-terminal domain-containing protein n=1 Tax=Microbacterium album TaxID=2053191 RepID=A0A917IDV6_9MICO|nr:PLD nuclease N-terminal domain-containing protein [Microbacterium album]GGH36376.1 hypothetical protein GCM10010921_05480 [Microbacterium album]